MTNKPTAPEPKGYSLTNYEKETIILFNEAEPTASIFTYNKRWQKHIESRFHIKPSHDNGDGGLTYILPKDRIRLPMPKRDMSPKRREASAKALKKARRKK